MIIDTKTATLISPYGDKLIDLMKQDFVQGQRCQVKSDGNGTHRVEASTSACFSDHKRKGKHAHHFN